MRGWGCSVLLLLASGCAHRLECREHGGGEVVRVASEHFDVVSTLPIEVTRTELSRLERLWDAFSVYFGHAPPPTEPLRVFLVGPGGVEEFGPGSAGFVQTTLQPVLVSAVSVDERGHAWSANAHELVHLLSAYWLPRQPRWIAEGLADYLGDASFRDESTLRFGRWTWSGGTVVELERLWDWDRASGSPDQEGDRYASAWAYLHYLANRDEARLARLWPALRSATSARAGFESVVPAAEWPALQRAVQAYVDEARFSGWESRTLRAPALGPPRVLAPWEVHVARGELLASLRMTRAAVAEFAVADRLAPRPRPAVVALGLLEDGLHGPRRTDALLELARLADAPVGVFLELASSEDLGPGERLRFAEDALARAPRDARALSAVTTQALLVPGQLERALAASEELTHQAPWATHAWMTRARALAAASRCQEAQRALDAAESLGLEDARALSARVLRVRHEVRDTCREAP